MLGCQGIGKPSNAGMLGGQDPTIPGFRSQDAGMPGCQDGVIPEPRALRMRPATQKPQFKDVCYGLPSALRMRHGSFRLMPSELRLMPAALKMKPGVLRMRPGAVRMRPGAFRMKPRSG